MTVNEVNEKLTLIGRCIPNIDRLPRKKTFKEGLNIVWLPLRFWRLNHWEFQGIDPWNKYLWTISTPFFCVGWFDSSIPDSFTD